MLVTKYKKHGYIVIAIWLNVQSCELLRFDFDPR